MPLLEGSVNLKICPPSKQCIMATSLKTWHLQKGVWVTTFLFKRFEWRLCRRNIDEFHIQLFFTDESICFRYQTRAIHFYKSGKGGKKVAIHHNLAWPSTDGHYLHVQPWQYTVNFNFVTWIILIKLYIEIFPVLSPCWGTLLFIPFSTLGLK